MKAQPCPKNSVREPARDARAIESPWLRAPLRVALLTAALGLAAGACGGGDSDNRDDTQGTGDAGTRERPTPDADFVFSTFFEGDGVISGTVSVPPETEGLRIEVVGLGVGNTISAVRPVPRGGTVTYAITELERGITYTLRAEAYRIAADTEVECTGDPSSDPPACEDDPCADFVDWPECATDCNDVYDDETVDPERAEIAYDECMSACDECDLQSAFPEEEAEPTYELIAVGYARGAAGAPIQDASGADRLDLDEDLEGVDFALGSVE